MRMENICSQLLCTPGVFAPPRMLEFTVKFSCDAHVKDPIPMRIDWRVSLIVQNKLYIDTDPHIIT